jgi:GrpB-like predicted nucleotidyltransferase (UPF0157 family)
VSNSDEPVDTEFLIGGNERRDIVLVDYDPSWPARFHDEWAKITTALAWRRSGSTCSSPSLILRTGPATCPHCNARVREPGHRMVRTPELDVHVHIWSDGDPAVTAHLAFRNRLRQSTADRDLYAATKRRLAQQDWPTMDHYADAKSDVILQTLSRSNS